MDKKTTSLVQLPFGALAGTIGYVVVGVLFLKVRHAQALDYLFSGFL